MTATATAEFPALVLQLKVADGEILAEAPVAGPTEVVADVPAGTAVYGRVWPADPDFIAQQGGVALTNVVWVD